MNHRKKEAKISSILGKKNLLFILLFSVFWTAEDFSNKCYCESQTNNRQTKKKKKMKIIIVIIIIMRMMKTNAFVVYSK